MSLTAPQIATLKTELTNDPEALGYSPFVTIHDLDSLISLLTFTRDGATPCPVNGVIGGPTGTVTGATNATPIVITSTNHGLNTGDSVVMSNVGGNTAANSVPVTTAGGSAVAPIPSWVVTKINANSFSLNSSVGNGAYTSGGTWQWCVGTLANGNKIFNASVLVKYVTNNIAPADVGAAVTNTQQLLLASILNPNGNVQLTDAAGNETSGALWLQLLTTAGTVSRKAVKALETRFGGRLEQILNAPGIVPTEADITAALS